MGHNMFWLYHDIVASFNRCALSLTDGISLHDLLNDRLRHGSGKLPAKRAGPQTGSQGSVCKAHYKLEDATKKTVIAIAVLRSVGRMNRPKN